MKIKIKIKHIDHNVLIQLDIVLLYADCNFYSDLMYARIVQINLIGSMYCAGIPFIVHMKNENGKQICRRQDILLCF